MVRVKICGLTNLEDAQAAVEAGADALGFVLYPRSPRYVRPETAAEIASKLPPWVVRVAVAVRVDLAMVERVEQVWRPDVWQLHGGEGPEVSHLLAPRRVVQAVGLPRHEPLRTGDFRVEAFLLDKASPSHGGTGETFDWALARQFQENSAVACILSGGLRVENIVQALEMVRPSGVDVSSGVEQHPGKKDHRKMKELIELCRKF